MKQFLRHQIPRPHSGIIGHRGAAGLAPENTLAAFAAAAELELNWVEFDVQCCASGEWVLFHDQRLERTSNGRGLIQETSWQVLKNLDVGAWFGPEYRGTAIPLLSEALQYLAASNLHPNIEIKVADALVCPTKAVPPDLLPPLEGVRSARGAIAARGIYDRASLSGPQNFRAIKTLLKTIQHFWPSMNPPPLISSFDAQLLLQIQSLAPELPLGYLSDCKTQTFEQSLQHVLDSGFDALHCDYRALNSNFIQLAHQQGVPLLAYTVNDPGKTQELISQGLFGVFSDMVFSAHNPALPSDSASATKPAVPQPQSHEKKKKNKLFN